MKIKRYVDGKFANRLMNLIACSRMTITDVCRKSGVNKGCMYDYINQVSEPNIENLIALCKALNTDPNTLLGWGEKNGQI